jgi:hypothetical protein
MRERVNKNIPSGLRQEEREEINYVSGGFPFCHPDIARILQGPMTKQRKSCSSSSRSSSIGIL